MFVLNHLFHGSNFCNLALFICHLFVSGNFRVGQILYDPKVFDGHLTAEIDSVCSARIPWQTNDVTRPMPPSHVSERTDYILQLIFFDPNTLAEDIRQFQNLFTFYRLFAFLSIPNETELKHRISIISQTNSILYSSPLILHYNLDNGLINVHLTSEINESAIANPLNRGFKTLNDQEYMLLFDQTFGKYEQKQSLAINAPLSFRKEEDYTNIKSHIPNVGHTYYANYFFSSLNATYLNMSCTLYNTVTPPVSQILTPKTRKYYKELSFDYEPIKKESLVQSNREHMNNLHFGSFAMDSETNQGIKTHSLYPYESTKLAVMFVYGEDFHRRINVLNFTATVKLAAVIIILFMSLTAFILHKMRLKLNHRRADISSSVIDILIAFIACGNLRMRHKIERWFFAILLIGAFFMTPIFTSGLLNEVYRIQDQKITTFEQLAKIPSPIYINPSFNPQEEQICGLLRQKMGPKINYKGIEKTIKLAPYHNGSFIYVGEAYRPENFLSTFVINGRDFDLLEEILGSVNTNFYLQSDHYVPERLLNKINAKTSSIMENGLNQFYSSFTTFQRKLFGRDYAKPKEDFQALSMSQLKRPMIVLFGFWIITVIAFIAERLKFRWRSHDHGNN